jgi:Ca2+-binding EF-hand superfamily protein
MRVGIIDSFFLLFVYFSHVFAVFDRDHDGTIDFHEFLLAIAAGTPGDLDSHLKYVFQM